MNDARKIAGPVVTLRLLKNCGWAEGSFINLDEQGACVAVTPLEQMTIVIIDI